MSYPVDELTMVDGERTVHVFFGDERMASHRPRDSGYYGEISWFHQDYLGSTNFVSKKHAVVHSQVEYFPSGEPWYEHRDEAFQLRAPAFLFTGKEYERSTGLYAFGFRHYDPVVGQWLSPDPAMPDFFTTGLAGGVFEQRNLATYSYAWNNPVGAKDPDGLAVETPWDVWNVVLGATSLAVNLIQGNFEEAAVDAGGMIVDIVATGLPGVPGGAATANNARRAAQLGEDVLRNADRVADVVKEVDHVADVSRALKCFAGGTLVETKQGPREIEAIVEGDWVWAKDELSGKEGWYPVRGVFRKHGQPLLAMGFSDGDGLSQRLEVTAEHPFWSQDEEGWVNAEDLDLGERVTSLDGELALVSVQTLSKRTTVFNFEVEGAHNYFVGEAGVWVHNSCGGKLKATGRTRRRASRQQRDDALSRSRGSDGVETCEYCGVEVQRTSGSPNSVEIDHQVPYARGGETVDENLVVSCRTCNRSKGSKSLGTEWIPPKNR